MAEDMRGLDDLHGLNPGIPCLSSDSLVGSGTAVCIECVHVCTCCAGQ